MKLTIVISLLGVLAVAGNSSYAQNTRFNINQTTPTLAGLIDKIESTSEFIFIFNDEAVDPYLNINFSAKDKTAEEILQEALMDTDYSFEILGRQIIIKPKDYHAEAIYTETENSLLQQIRITGTVTDVSTGESLPGVNILIEGTSTGTVTDIDGNFAINVPDRESILTFSFVGYIPQNVVVGNREIINVQLVSDIAELDEVVVIGYGTLDRREVSSSIVSVRREEFIESAASNPMDLLTGKVAGLTVNATAPANPRSNPDLQIRGATSLSASNEPLIVINGVPGGNLQSLSVQDIESITILRDGASSAIYGTRGANGVILITTKQGTTGPGEFNVTYESWFGTSIISRVPEVLSAEEFRQLRSDKVDYGGNDDWYRAIMNDFSYDHNQYINLSSSMENAWFNASFNYKDAKGLEMGNQRTEYGGRFDMMQRALDGFAEFTGSVNLRSVWQDNRGIGFGGMLRKNPTIPIYDENGEYWTGFDDRTDSNPIQDLHQRQDMTDRLYMRADAGIRLNLIQQSNQTLSTRLSLLYDRNEMDRQRYTPSTITLRQQNYAGEARLDNGLSSSRLLDWVTNYQLDMDDGSSLRLLAGYSYQDFESSSRWFQNRDFAVDDFLWNDIGSGTYLREGDASMSSTKSAHKLIAMFGRANHNWRNLVFTSASLRYEGSTKFGRDEKWGYFPAASIALEMANLDFFQDITTLFNSFKLRASYGITGRSDFSSYQSLATYSTTGFYNMNGVWVTAFGPSRNPNPGLKWERGINTNLGLDFTLFGHRLTGSIDWFTRKSEDLLYQYSAPQPPMIFSQILVNVGTVINNGWEATLRGDIIRSESFSWNSGVIFSTGKTILDKLSDDVYGATHLDMDLIPGIGSTLYRFRYEEGGEIGRFFGWKHAGVSEDGELLIYDLQGNILRKGQETPAERQYIGSGVPKAYFSFSNTLRYNKFDLNIFLTSALGFDILNWADYDIGYMGSEQENVLRIAYSDERAQITGDPRLYTSLHVQDGSYLKIENISLGYRTNIQSPYIDRLRVFVSARNVYTFTSYPGQDPSIVRTTGLTPGTDQAGAYPTAIQLSAGLTVNF